MVVRTNTPLPNDDVAAASTPIPALVFEIVGLKSVSLTDGSNKTTEIGPFGICLPVDNLRIMVAGNKIALFGTPSASQRFGFSWASHSFTFAWGTKRVSIDGRFAIEGEVFQMRSERLPPGPPTFRLRCECEHVDALTVEIGGHQEEKYLVNFGKEEAVWMIPCSMYAHLSEQFEKCEIGSVAQEEAQTVADNVGQAASGTD